MHFCSFTYNILHSSYPLLFFHFNNIRFVLHSCLQPTVLSSLLGSDVFLQHRVLERAQGTLNTVCMKPVNRFIYLFNLVPFSSRITGCGMNYLTSFPIRSIIFLSAASWAVLWPIRTAVCIFSWVLCPMLNLPAREASHSPPSSAEVSRAYLRCLQWRGQ